MRFFGMMLLMLLFSLLHSVGAKPASAMSRSNENRNFTSGFFCDNGTASLCGEPRPAADAGCRAGDRLDPAPPHAIQKYTSVFYRLRPGIVTIPRMNRTPKPKSVYRCFTRAPGPGIAVEYDTSVVS